MAFRTTLIGLGVIGSSIGLALKKTGVAFELVGHDKDTEAARRAQKSGAVDRTDWNLIGACEGADLIVISIPLSSIKDTLSAIRGDLKEGCVITDTASLKGPVLTWARESLPPSVHFVGGHPILRKDMPRPVEPAADLFQGALYCLTPQADAPPMALQTVSDLAEAVGARPHFVDAYEHDGLIAALEQLPLLMGMTLQQTLSSSSATRELQRLAGPEFSAATQPVGGDSPSLAEWCSLNASNLARWLDAYIADMTQLRDTLGSTESPTLQEAFSRIQELHNQWVLPAKDGDDRDYDAFGPARMLLGGLFAPRKPKS